MGEGKETVFEEGPVGLKRAGWGCHVEFEGGVVSAGLL